MTEINKLTNKQFKDYKIKLQALQSSVNQELKKIEECKEISDFIQSYSLPSICTHVIQANASVSTILNVNDKLNKNNSNE